MRFKPVSCVVLTIYVLFAGVIVFAQAAAPNASLTAETINPGADSSAQHLTVAQKQQVDDLLREQSERLEAALHNREIASTGQPENVDAIMKDISDRIHAVLTDASGAAQQNNANLPSAPAPETPVAPEHYGLRPSSANYSQSKGFFPITLSIYKAKNTPSPSFTNTPRIDQLLQNGNLMLGLDDAIALALEKTWTWRSRAITSTLPIRICCGRNQATRFAASALDWLLELRVAGAEVSRVRLVVDPVERAPEPEDRLPVLAASW